MLKNYKEGQNNYYIYSQQFSSPNLLSTGAQIN